MYNGIVPVTLKKDQLRFHVTHKIKHQTMLVCINATGETLCLLIVTSNQSPLGVFRDGSEENLDLKYHVGRTVYVITFIFHDYLQDVLILRIEDFHKANICQISRVIPSWTTVHAS
jgi:hypothetical protein